jgi:hypothetical protein
LRFSNPASRLSRSSVTHPKSFPSDPTPATSPEPIVPIEKSNHVPCKRYALNPAAVRIFVYGLAPSGKRLSYENESS